MNKRLYIIGGMFQDPRWGPGGFPFGGFFIADDYRGQYLPTEIPSLRPEKIIAGKLTDKFGDSDIIGTMNDANLKFLKRYISCKDKIVYQFSNKEGLWIGSWNSNREGQGKAVANLQLFIEGPMITPVNTLNPGNIDKFIEYLLREGYIKKV